MKRALLLIDIQNFYFFEGPCRLHEPERAGRQAAQILYYFRKTNQPVIFIQHLYNGGGYSQPYQDVIAINTIVEPLPGEAVVQKNYPNSFRETALKDILKELEVTDLTVTGMMSHMCVDTTVRAAADLGYKVTVIEDACTTMNLAFDDEVIPAVTAHRAFMASLQGAFADVVTAEEYLMTK